MLYRIFNLVIESSIEIPLLQPHVADTATPDIVFYETSVAENLPEASFQGPFYQFGKDEFLFEIEGCARFLCRNGKSVEFQRTEGASDMEVALFLLGSALGGLLQQRGEFLLHACAVEFNGSGWLFSGESGTGKSTLSAALVGAGCRLISDDVCLLKMQKDNPLVYPGFPSIKLWKDSLSMLQIPSTGLAEIGQRVDKFYWPVPQQQFCQEPKPVQGFVGLESGTNQSLHVIQLRGIEKQAALIHNTYRREMLDHVGERVGNFRYWEPFAHTIPMYKLFRPQSLPLKKMVNDILKIFQKRRDERCLTR